jgi:two-component system sensor histidine kinase TctE
MYLKKLRVRAPSLKDQVLVLAQRIGSQGADEIQPIECADLADEIQPIAQAINERMARLGRLMDQQRGFLDDAAHQLRTPLAALHAQVGHAIRQGPSGELAQVLRAIELQLETASRSVTQLLSLARADAMTPVHESFDMAELLREIGWGLLPLAAAKTLDFGVEVDATPCMCSGDRHLLGEAISNLAHNAVVYADHGGTVTLVAKANAEEVTFAAVNTGSPIPGSILCDVGQRFVRGRQGSGAGLGLAIAKSIVERHGGRLSLRSVSADKMNTAQLWWPQAVQH